MTDSPASAPRSKNQSGKRSHAFPQRSNRSRIGAVAMALVSLLFVVLSYRLQNVIFEVNSVIAFVAAVVLLFKDQSRSVQMRIVDRMTSSSEMLIKELSSYGFEGASFRYLPGSGRISDVVMVPLKPSADPGDDHWTPSGGEEGLSVAAVGEGASDEAPEMLRGGMPSKAAQMVVPPRDKTAIALSSSSALLSRSGLSVPHLPPGPSAAAISQTIPSSITKTPGEVGSETATHGSAPAVLGAGTLKLIPPGRGLAELFCRELGGEERPSVSELGQALPNILAQNFGFAASAGVSAGDDTVQVRLLHPAFRHACGGASEAMANSGVIGCTICSFLAVVFCYSSGRLVSLRGCSYDEASDTSTVSLLLGPQPPTVE